MQILSQFESDFNCIVGDHTISSCPDVSLAPHSLISVLLFLNNTETETETQPASISVLLQVHVTLLLQVQWSRLQN